MPVEKAHRLNKPFRIICGTDFSACAETLPDGNGLFTMDTDVRQNVEPGKFKLTENRRFADSGGETRNCSRKTIERNIDKWLFYRARLLSLPLHWSSTKWLNTNPGTCGMSVLSRSVRKMISPLSQSYQPPYNKLLYSWNIIQQYMWPYDKQWGRVIRYRELQRGLYKAVKHLAAGVRLSTIFHFLRCVFSSLFKIISIWYRCIFLPCKWKKNKPRGVHVPHKWYREPIHCL